MQRPDINTLACLNPECQQYSQPGAGNLALRKEYGHDHIRLLRCKACKEEFSERRGTPLFNTKIPESKAASVVEHPGGRLWHPPYCPPGEGQQGHSSPPAENHRTPCPTVP